MQVEWIDIHRDAEAVYEIGAEREFVRERLHVVDENGDIDGRRRVRCALPWHAR